jgi:hypothetical protein
VAFSGCLLGAAKAGRLSGASGQILAAVGRVSRTVAQCHQEAQCCLTPRSSGAPTSRRAGHQAQGLRPILRLLSSAPRCWLPLTSNVRQHVRALRFASISIQMQLSAAVASIQIAVPPFFVAVAKVVAKPTTRAVTNAAITSFGVRESRSRSTRSQNTTNSCRWPSRLTNRKPELSGHPVALHSVAAQGCQSRGKFSPFQVSYIWCSTGMEVLGARQAKFWWQSVAFPVQLGNATKKRSAA